MVYHAGSHDPDPERYTRSALRNQAEFFSNKYRGGDHRGGSRFSNDCYGDGPRYG